MFVKKCLVIIISLLCLTSGRAQEQSRDTSILMVTVTPTSLFGFNPMLRAGVEYWFQPNSRVELEGGWLFGSNWIREKQRGARVVGSFKFGEEGRINLILNTEYRRITQDKFSYREELNGLFFIAENTTRIKSRLGGSIGIGRHFYYPENKIGIEWSIVIGPANLNERDSYNEIDNMELLKNSNSLTAFIDFTFKCKFPVKRWF